MEEQVAPPAPEAVTETADENRGENRARQDGGQKEAGLTGRKAPPLQGRAEEHGAEAVGEAPYPLGDKDALTVGRDGSCHGLQSDRDGELLAVTRLITTVVPRAAVSSMSTLPSLAWTKPPGANGLCAA